MKKRNVLVTTVTLFVLLISGSAWAQYPQLTSEAGQAYQKMRKELYAHSDSAWAVAYPIVMKEAQNGRPYVLLGKPSLRFASGKNSRFPRC